MEKTADEILSFLHRIAYDPLELSHVKQQDEMVYLKKKARKLLKKYTKNV